MFTVRPRDRQDLDETAERGAGKPRRGRYKSLLVLTGVGAAAALGLGGLTAPAHADEGGNVACWASTGTLTATVVGTSAPHPIEIQWSAQVPYCEDYALYINGPGFAPNSPPPSGGLTFTYLPPGTTGTWTLTLVDIVIDDYPYQLATTTITAP